MPLKYKIDVLAALKEAGFTTYRIRQEKVFNETTLQQLRRGDIVPWKQIEKLCHLLHCQPGDLVEYVEPVEESYTCDNCKHLDDCPSEYKEEQPNWCENWE